jgi:hypothetical protein
MTGNSRSLLTAILYISITAGLTGTAGCASGSYAAKGAGEGATTGAVAGAVGGMVTALVFGGNVAEAGARGAVYGGTTGAVVGGMSGAKADEAAAAQKQAEREAELDKLRNRIGSDAFNGVVALAECKHEIAIANAREATKSKKSDYALAGMWVLVLAEADRNNEAAARALYPDIVKRDSNIKTEADAEAGMREALDQLGNIRTEYDMPAVCPS